MFDQKLIPAENPQIKQFLSGVLAQSGVNPESKAVHFILFLHLNLHSSSNGWPKTKLDNR